MRPMFPSLIAASAAAKKARVVGMLILAVGFLATPMLMPSAGNAQDARVAKSMAALKDQTAKLGAPKIDGRDPVGGKDAPALYFGSTKMNNNFTVVDEVAKEDGQGMAATLFVKDGDEYIRVATNVPKPDGSGRAIGTILAGPALEFDQNGQSHTTARPRSLARPMSPVMNRSRTHRVQSSAFTSSATAKTTLRPRSRAGLPMRRRCSASPTVRPPPGRLTRTYRAPMCGASGGATGHDRRGTGGLGHRPHACADRHDAGAARCEEGIAAGDGGPLQGSDARATGEGRRCTLAARQQRRR